MDTFYYVLIFSLLGGVMSLSAAAILLSKKTLTEKLIVFATPFAAGALLAAVFFDLLREGLHLGGGDKLLFSTLAGILAFFLAEKFFNWFHHHHGDEKEKEKGSPNLIIIGDLMHNAIDGIVIAAAFLISIPTGIVTTLAVAAHEIPQEIGDFGLLLSKGMSRKNVLLVNVITALSTTVAALVTYILGSDSSLPTEVLIGLSAGFLLYIAMSDIIPTIHNHSKNKKLIDVGPIMLLLGVAIVGFVIVFSHQFIDEGAHGHSHSHNSSEVESDNRVDEHGDDEQHKEHEDGHESHHDDEHEDDGDHHEDREKNHPH